MTRSTVLAILLLAIASTTGWAGTYRYKDAQFNAFVKESFAYCGRGSSADFYKWMDTSYTRNRSSIGAREKTLEGFMAANTRKLKAVRGRTARSAATVDLSARLHKLIKKMIPKFSLDRGFEFAYTVKYGERQCFLQSVLIAGMLQKMGVSAGVDMVWKNIEGVETNNGHAVCVVRLPDGKDLIVDASDPIPFVKHRGLFAQMGAGHAFVEPAYAPNSNKIDYYRAASGGKKLATSQIECLNNAFLRSMFWYYRGERTPGGLVIGKKNRSGIERGAKALQMSAKISSQNPLAVYMLGRSYLDLGSRTDAQKMLTKADSLYRRFGWVPAGVLDALAELNRQALAVPAVR